MAHLYCLYALFTTKLLQGTPLTTLCPTNITGKIMVQQNKGKVNRFIFLYLCYFISEMASTSLI